MADKNLFVQINVAIINVFWGMLYREGGEGKRNTSTFNRIQKSDQMASF